MTCLSIRLQGTDQNGQTSSIGPLLGEVEVSNRPWVVEFHNAQKPVRGFKPIGEMQVPTKGN